MSKRLGKKRRLAGAAVEMAVVTPLLLTLLFGIIEYGWTFSVKQSLVTAAREGAREASMPGSSDDEIRDRVQEYLAPMGVTSAEVELTRASPPDQPTETVTVTVPYADISLLGGFFGTTDYDLRSSCSMRKEGLD